MKELLSCPVPLGSAVQLLALEAHARKTIQLSAIRVSTPGISNERKAASHAKDENAERRYAR